MFIRFSDTELIIFSGGMPRASFGDRNTVTVMIKEKKHVVFDFTSKVIDFFTLMPRQEDKDNQGPAALVVLVEEEIVVIDLGDPDWKMMALPYLVSLHASAVSIIDRSTEIAKNNSKTQLNYLIQFSCFFFLFLVLLNKFIHKKT